ncbi:MAG TPA: triose-phosphate isomerase [Bacteroidia bacterium]|nr:triose-phosphate isomerase [Bacteroidia bacterium]
MRKKIVCGNWKMNLLNSEAINLVEKIIFLLKENPAPKIEKIIAPPFIYLNEFSKKSTDIKIAAQNCSSENNGAFTGEISAKMIASVGTKYVIIGHSERRNYFSEDANTLTKKINLCLENKLQPIFCIGETLEQRTSNNQFKIIKTQLAESTFHLNETDFSKLIIAYEPVWAIGTGKTATKDQAQEMHQFIRKIISEKYNAEIAQNCSILYGGSCNASNAKELFECPDIDGGLIGGASLKAEDFVRIIHSFPTTKS